MTTEMSRRSRGRSLYVPPRRPRGAVRARGIELSVAVIAATATVLGAAIGAPSAYIAAKVQSTASDELASASFRRDQRKDTYAQVLDKLNALDQVSRSLAILDYPSMFLTTTVRVYKDCGCTADAKRQQLVATYQAAIEAIEEQRVAVELVASTSTFRAFVAAVQSKKHVLASYAMVIGMLGSEHRMSAEIAAQLSEAYSSIQASDMADSAFIAAARSDLDLGSDP